jgi:hypothetical protein
MDRIREQRGEVGMAGWVVITVILGSLAAIPFVLMMRSEGAADETAVAQIPKATDVQAETMLTDAIRGAQTAFAEQQTLVGYGPSQAAEFDPQTRYDASPTAETGIVSIRGGSATGVVMVTKGGTGPLCIAMNAGVVSYGHADAASGAQCAGTEW